MKRMENRRSFVKRSGAMAAVALGGRIVLNAGASTGREPGARILPERLRQGDLIGLVTPGAPVTDQQVRETVEKLEGLGLRTTYGDTVLAEYGYFAGRDESRAGEVMELFTRKDIDGIWCVRGGYGSIRILDYLDYETIGQNPKVFIGYSDVTAIHTAIFKETGLVTFHGPLGISEFNRFSVNALKKVVMGTDVPGKFAYRREKKTKDNEEFDRYTINPGIAEGILTGGNISVLDSMTGTRFEPDFRGRIAYLEEVEEKTYRVDRMLYHLLSATNLREAAGIVLGVFNECNINDEPRLTLRQALSDLLKPLGIPVTYGFAFGHIGRMVTIPNGLRARLDADRNSLELLEPAVQ